MPPRKITRLFAFAVLLKPTLALSICSATRRCRYGSSKPLKSELKMDSIHIGFSPFLLLLLLQLLNTFSPIPALNSDGLSLLALKAATNSNPNQAFSNWKEDDEIPCNWTGISCTFGRVTGISLPGKGLHGYIPSEVGALIFLQQLILPNNYFTGQIPSRLFNATSLQNVDLSSNSLSGVIPPEIGELNLSRLLLFNNSLTGKLPADIGKLTNLTQLDLSANLLNGTLPPELGHLSSLSGTLNLSYNRFSGSVPETLGNLPVTVSLDLGHNNLSGPVPQTGSLVNQGPTAFSGNPNLCGFPLQTPCLTSNPAFSDGIPPFLSTEEKRVRSRGAEIFALTIGNAAGISTIGVVLVWFFRKRNLLWECKTGKSECGSEREGKKGEFFVMDEGFAFELEDLLRSSAYVLGKSRMGIVYKVVLRNGGGGGEPGGAVAVRRLNDSGSLQRFKEFEAEVQALGRVRHSNIVRLRAYYWAVDDKLLVCDFISNGSLHSSLHGNSTNPSSPPLPWPTRLKIAQGAARGLAHLHECSPRKYVHGNLKSSKILLDQNFDAYISGFGLSRLVTGTSTSSNPIAAKQSSAKCLPAGIHSKIPASSNLNYLPPESRVSGTKPTQKSDVYSFGITLLELLTGKLPEFQSGSDMGLVSFVRKAFQEERPLSEIVDQALLSEVYTKKQVLAVFHVALSCTESDPESRPRMKAVSENLERIGAPLSS